MPTRISRRRRLKKYSIGDMRQRITIHSRVITPPVFDNTSITETYDDGIEYWATIETLDKKIQVFDNVNIPPSATHFFVIRFDSTVNSERIVRWLGNSYEILKTSDPDGRRQYTELFSRLMGDETLDANQ